MVEATVVADESSRAEERGKEEAAEVSYWSGIASHEWKKEGVSLRGVYSLLSL
jgi:hypothetical protein